VHRHARAEALARTLRGHRSHPSRARWPRDGQADLAVVSRPLDWLDITYYTRQICRFDAGVPLWQSRRVEGDRDKNDLG
jgi:hypothetical protein